jgi:DnaJ-class molecular chaperone
MPVCTNCNGIGTVVCCYSNIIMNNSYNGCSECYGLGVKRCYRCSGTGVYPKPKKPS